MFKHSKNTKLTASQRSAANLLLVIILIVTFIVGTNSFSAPVLCYGSDGHVAIESPLTGFCHPTPNSSTLSSDELSSSTLEKNLGVHYTSQKPSCTDLPLSLHSAPEGQSRVQTIQEPESRINFTGFPLVQSLKGFLQTASPGVLSQPPPFYIDSNRALIQTVRLLI